MMIARRAVIAGVGALAIAPPAFAAGDAPMLGPDALVAWAAVDLGAGRRMGHASDRRMPMCSSFKWLLAAFVLWRVDRGLERLDRPVTFGPGDLIPASPVTTAVVGAAGGAPVALSVAALAQAITSVSDNAAANLLLRRVGGPAALTGWLRAHGDATTSCNRFEPENNRVPPGDPRDTTTPDASIADLRRFLYGDVLAPEARATLMAWMLGCSVGEARLKAGLPAGWRIAHRTGTRDLDPADRAHGWRATAVDLGVLLPPTGAPILIAAYATGWTRPLAEAEAWMAGLARQVAREWRV